MPRSRTLSTSSPPSCATRPSPVPTRVRPNSLPAGKNAANFGHFGQFGDEPSRKATRFEGVPGKFPTRPNREVIRPIREIKFPARAKTGIKHGQLARLKSKALSFGGRRLNRRRLAGAAPAGDPDRPHGRCFYFPFPSRIGLWFGAKYPERVKSLSLHSCRTGTDPFLETVAKGLGSVQESDFDSPAPGVQR